MALEEQARGVGPVDLETLVRGAVTFEQASALGELTVRWTGTESGDVAVSDEFDEPGDPGGADGRTPQDDPTDPDATDQSATDQNATDPNATDGDEQA